MCPFIYCNTTFGGGANTHYGPTNTVSSCLFISCTAKLARGGIFHNSPSYSSALTISNSLFSGNTVKSVIEAAHGGGRFEDYRANAYTLSIRSPSSMEMLFLQELERIFLFTLMNYPQKILFIVLLHFLLAHSGIRKISVTRTSSPKNVKTSQN